MCVCVCVCVCVIANQPTIQRTPHNRWRACTHKHTHTHTHTHTNTLSLSLSLSHTHKHALDHQEAYELAIFQASPLTTAGAAHASGSPARIPTAAPRTVLSYDIWMSHVTYKRVVSHMNTSMPQDRILKHHKQRCHVTGACVK